MAYWSKKYKKFPYAKHVKHDGGKNQGSLHMY